MARRMADWTTKGLFSALVLVGGLGFGKQVIRWWGDDESAPAVAGPAAPAFDLAAGAGPVEIAAGNSNLRFGRQMIAGDQAEATKSLRAACRQALATAAPWSPSADAEEQNLLTRLAQLEPAEQLSQAEARLYEPVPGMPLAIGVRRFADASEGGSQDATSPPDRVVLWGLAAPAGENAWTLYLFRVRQPGAGGDARPPLPPGCRRLMAFSNSAGAGTVAFQGTGGCDEYRRFYQAWQAEHWPQAVADWRPAPGGGWQATIARGDSAAADGAVKSLAIHLVPRQFAGCTGLVFVSP
ncbi:MAG TPA: hypothetical protein VMV10_17415 [Pirellulales bacterium]|nr:hypothetical protein [Pirellulales bacterium]